MTTILVLVGFAAMCWAAAAWLVRFHERGKLPNPVRDMRREVYRAHAWSHGEAI